MEAVGDPSNTLSNFLCSGLIVSAWGFFLLNGVADPEGGTKALWPIFGIANQLLASIALCFGTVILLKRQLRLMDGRPAIALVTALPLAWLLTVTTTAAVQKIGHADPRIGFLAAARKADTDYVQLQLELEKVANDATAAEAVGKKMRAAQRVSLNMRTDAAVTVGFLTLVAVLLGITSWEAALLLSRRKEAVLSETEPVWLAAPDAQKNGVPVAGIVGLGLALIQELSGQAAVERERIVQQTQCECPPNTNPRANAFLLSSKRRFEGVNRCC